MAKSNLKLYVSLGIVGAVGYLAMKQSKAKTEAQHGTPDTLDPKTGTPVPGKLPVGRPATEMSETLKKRVAEALGALAINPLNGNVMAVPTPAAIQQATGVIGQLEAEGFYETANQMRAFVDKAQKFVPTPPAAAPIAQATPPGLTPAQRDYITRVLTMERSPRTLQTFKTWLMGLPPSPERDSMIKMTEALIVQVEAAASTANTLDKVADVVRSQSEETLDKVMKEAAKNPPAPAPVPPPPKPMVTSPGWPQPAKALPQPPPPTPTAAKPAPALPEKPKVVPPTPVPQPAPPPLTPVQLAGRAMVADLKATVSRKGGPKEAKGFENKELVKKFQSLSGGTADGLAGPATYLRAAAVGAVDLPLVLYWPKSATATTVNTYRSKLRELADNFASQGRDADANRLRMTANLERGQGGIVGKMPTS